MMALSALIKIHSRLSNYDNQRQVVGTTELRQSLDELAAVVEDLRSLEPFIQSALEASDGLAMALVMMDAAHDRKLDADKLRCLLAPLGEKLERSVEGMREAI